MCKVSDKLKLCSCKTEDVQTLKHYWVLKRPFKTEDYLLGSIVPPADIGEELEKYNIITLQKILNEGNSFDVELQHEEKDILELHFTVKSNDSSWGNYLVYAFVFRKGKWKPTEYDHFGNGLSEVRGGKVLKPFVI